LQIISQKFAVAKNKNKKLASRFSFSPILLIFYEKRGEQYFFCYFLCCFNIYFFLFKRTAVENVLNSQHPTNTGQIWLRGRKQIYLNISLKNYSSLLILYRRRPLRGQRIRAKARGKVLLALGGGMMVKIIEGTDNWVRLFAAQGGVRTLMRWATQVKT